jgi:hypothetical protein
MKHDDIDREYLETRSDLVSLLTDFNLICKKRKSNFRNELSDCVYEAKINTEMAL